MVDLAERGTTMATAAPPQSMTDDEITVWEFWERLELPPGWHAEVLRGELIVSPTPMPQHNLIGGELSHMLMEIARTQRWVVTNTQAFALPAADERVIPDLFVIPRTAMKGKHWVLPPDELILVCEITSPSTRHRDLDQKLSSYAAANIPIYLLVDNLDGDGYVTAFSMPDGNKAYKDQTTVRFGETLRLPDPVACDIDTGRFFEDD
jgi:Uma2 family endonuclease